MKPKGKAYVKQVLVPKVWEDIEYRGKTERVLVTKAVSTYIRKLEKKNEQLKKQIKKKV